MFRRSSRTTTQTLYKNISQTLEAALDKKLAESLTSLGKDSEKLITSLLEEQFQKLGAEISQLSVSAGSSTEGASGLQGASSRLGSAIGRLINSAVNEAFNHTRTRTTQQETQRSIDTAQLTLSKSQQQAQTAIDVQKGSKNL